MLTEPSLSFVDLYVPCHVHCVVQCSVQSAGQHGSTQTNRQQPFLHVVAHHTDARLCTKLACCSAPLFIRFVYCVGVTLEVRLHVAVHDTNPSLR